MNRSGNVQSSLTVNDIPGGIYELRVTLYSSSNANGSVLGQSRVVLDLCSGGAAGTTATVVTTNSRPAATVEVFPPNVEVNTQTTTQFIATGWNNGEAVFLATDGVDWDVVGGLGTVTDSGQFTALTAGNGSVRAFIGPIQGIASVAVNQRNVTTTEWTVMVFLNAANDLYSFSDLDIEEMLQVADNPNLRFVVQWKQSKDAWAGSSFDGVRRVLISSDGSGGSQLEVIQNNLQDGGEHLDMGDPAVLNDFIKWSKENFPANRYALILWNHGNGWRRSPVEDWTSRAFSYDDQFGSSIQIWELDEALAGETVDILAWDSSLMQMIEVAYEARDYASFVVGSEESPPGRGYPYHLVFDPFRDNPFASTATLSKGFVDGMLAEPLYQNRKITQSVLDTSRLSDLAMSIDELANQMVIHANDLLLIIPEIRNTAQAFSDTTSRKYRDLIDICERLEAHADVPDDVKTAATDVRLKAVSAIVWEGHNAESPGSKGISVDFSPSGVFANSSFDYGQMKFAQDTRWDEFLTQAP